MPVSNTGMDKDEQKGLLYGSLIAAGINAARGRNVGDGLLKAAQGGSQAYMGGLNHLYDRKKQELEAQRQEQLNKLTGMQVQKAQADIDMQPFERDKMLQEIATSKSLEQQRQIDAGKRVRLENENDIVGNLSMQRQTLPTDYLQKVIPEQGGQTVDKLLTGYLSEYEPGRKLLSEQTKAQQAKDELAQKERIATGREELGWAKMEASQRASDARLSAMMNNQNNALIRPMIAKTAGELPKLKTEAMTAKNVLPMYDRALELVKTGVTGKGGQFKAFISPYAESMGIDANNLKDSETFQLMANVIAGPMRLELIGPGAVTEYEQKLKQQMSGGGGVGRQAATELINYYKTIANQKIGNYNTSLEGAVTLHPDFGKLHQPVKYETPKKPTASPTPSGGGGNTRIKMPNGSIAEFDVNGKRIK